MVTVFVSCKLIAAEGGSLGSGKEGRCVLYEFVHVCFDLAVWSTFFVEGVLDVIAEIGRAHV